MATYDSESEREKERRRKQTVDILNGTNARRLTFGGNPPPAPPLEKGGSVAASAPDPVAMLFDRRRGSRVLPSGVVESYDYDPLLDRSNPDDRAAFRALMPTVVGEQSANWRTGVQDRGMTRRTGMQETGETRRTGMREGGAMDRAELTADVARGGQNIDALSVLAGLTQPQGGGGKAADTYQVQFDDMGEPTWIMDKKREATYPHPNLVRKNLAARLQEGDVGNVASYLTTFYRDFPEDMQESQFEQALRMMRTMTTPEQQRSIVERLYGR